MGKCHQKHEKPFDERSEADRAFLRIYNLNEQTNGNPYDIQVEMRGSVVVLPVHRDNGKHQTDDGLNAKNRVQYLIHPAENVAHFLGWFARILEGFGVMTTVHRHSNYPFGVLQH